MANKYDPPRMKRGAEDIERELERYREAKSGMNEAMRNIRSDAFVDSTGQRLTQMYMREAKPAMEEMEKTMSDFASLLKMCAKKFGSAIDNGNGYLSS